MSALSIAWLITMVWLWLCFFWAFLWLPYYACSSGMLKFSQNSQDKELAKLSLLPCMAKLDYDLFMEFPMAQMLVFVLAIGTIGPFVIPLLSANKQSNAPTPVEQSAGRRRR
jgi:hypothetical protein